jgi:hypothetical protein
VVIPEGQIHIIAPEDPKEPGVVWIKDIGTKVIPQSWDHLKLLIGIPDKTAERIPNVAPRQINSIASPEILKNRETSRLELTKSALEIAKGYIYSDSRAYRQYLPYLQEFFGRIEIWIPIFMNITIEKNATLTISKSVKYLLANNIYIKVGGKLKSRSDLLHISCKSIQGNLQ